MPGLARRHGFFSCYEAFIHIIDAMFNQPLDDEAAGLSEPWPSDPPQARGPRRITRAWQATCADRRTLILLAR